MLTRIQNLISALKTKTTPDRETLRRNGFFSIPSWEEALQRALDGDTSKMLAGIPPMYHQAVCQALGISKEIPTSPKNWTRDWVQNNPSVVLEVAKIVSRRVPMENSRDILSLTGEWIANWCAKDQFASIIQETNEVPLGLLASYVLQKHWVAMSCEGQDAIGRMYGRMTQTEVLKGRKVPKNPLSQRVVIDMAENEGDFSVMCEGDYNALDADAIRRMALKKVEKAFRKPIYLTVAEDLLASYGRQEIAERRDITPLRASQIISRVRGVMKDAV